MGELKNNPMMNTATGMVGDTVVFRRWRGRLIVANRPKRGGRTFTDKQLATQQKFTEASSYAKQTLADPANKAMYTAGISGTKYTAHMVAMSDYLNAPVVSDIDLSSYKGAVGDSISIKATDDFKVTTVKVVILSAAGAQLESGIAVQDAIAKLQWKYTVTAANATLAGTKVQATAYDVPGNTGYLEKSL
jgi:hypothetical protein